MPQWSDRARPARWIADLASRTLRMTQRLMQSRGSGRRGVRSHRSRVVASTGLVLSFGLSLALSLTGWPTQGLEPGLAVEVSSVVNPRQANNGWVADQADLLSDNAEAQLNALLAQLEASNGAEVAVVTVPDVAPSPSPKAFTTELFNTWGIGKEGQDNGVLVMVSKGDRRVEIETGYGMEATLPDARVGKIIREQMIPWFKQEDYEKAIVDGTLAVAVSIQPGLALPEIMPVALTQQAETLVQTWEQEAIREKEQAAQREANRIAQEEAEFRRLQRERQLEEERRASFAQRAPLYTQLMVGGSALVVVGLSLLFKFVVWQFREVSLSPVTEVSPSYPQEVLLNRGVKTAIAQPQLNNVFKTNWPYGILVAVGFAALTAGVMGWIVTSQLATGAWLIALAFLLLFKGVPFIQGQALLQVAHGLGRLQVQLCQQLSLNSWKRDEQVRKAFGIKDFSGSQLSQAVVALVTAFVPLVFILGIFFHVLSEVLNTFGEPDLVLAAALGAGSMVVSALSIAKFGRLERQFRVTHLGEQQVCQHCNCGIVKKELKSAEAVRAMLRQPEALSDVEAIAIDIGNIKYFAQACGRCHPGYPPGHTYLERQICSAGPIECPNCHEDTLESNITQTTAGRYYEFTRSEQCHHCGYEDVAEWKKKKPKPKPVYSSSSYSSSSDSSSFSSSSGSSASSSSSSGGGDFGGGGSGGGGAGGSW